MRKSNGSCVGTCSTSAPLSAALGLRRRRDVHGWAVGGGDGCCGAADTGDIHRRAVAASCCSGAPIQPCDADGWPVGCGDRVRRERGRDHDHTDRCPHPIAAAVDGWDVFPADDDRWAPAPRFDRCGCPVPAAFVGAVGLLIALDPRCDRAVRLPGRAGHPPAAPGLIDDADALPGVRGDRANNGGGWRWDGCPELPGLVDGRFAVTLDPRRDRLVRLALGAWRPPTPTPYGGLPGALPRIGHEDTRELDERWRRRRPPSATSRRDDASTLLDERRDRPLDLDGRVAGCPEPATFNRQVRAAASLHP